MNSRKLIKKKRIPSALILLALPGLILFCSASEVRAGESDAVIAASGSSPSPIYRQPETGLEIRRRERSVEGGETRGFDRGLTRGFDRGVTRGFVRGLTRGFARGLTRGFHRGLTRGFARGLARGSARGLTRGKDIGATRSRPVDSEPERFRLPATISAIAPLRTGLTLKPQPVLQWYSSGLCDYKIEFILNETEAINPVLKLGINGVYQEGIYRVDLARHGVSLVPGVEYEWFVVISLIPDEPSFDYLASATIIYKRPPENLARRIRNTPGDQLHILYADQGYWYDAMESLSNMIGVNPGDDTFKLHRSELFTQVDMPPPVIAYGGAAD